MLKGTSLVLNKPFDFTLGVGQVIQVIKLLCFAIEQIEVLMLKGTSLV
jgi:hypothetical protein